MLSKMELFARVMNMSLETFFEIDQLVQPEGLEDIVEMHSSP